jgi:glycosyltransferase involved in cell wall biosynthesis
MSSVGVVIPSYNYGGYLADCVESVLGQEGVEVEVLVIDDCSADDTPEVGAALASRDPRVTFRRHQSNQGHIATYNEGLEWVSADYTVLLSADDLLVPGALKRATAVLDANPEVGFVYGRPLAFVDSSSLPPARTRDPRPDLWDGEAWIARRAETATSCISSPEVVVRTRLQRELGGYDPNLPHAGDLEMWLRFAAHSDVVYLRRVDQAYYRVHPESMARSAFSDPLADLRQRKMAFETVLCNHSESFADPAAIGAVANRALAGEALWRACRLLDTVGSEEASIADLEGFAFEAYPDARSLPEHRQLRRRQWLGPRVTRLLPSFYLAAVSHRVRTRRWWRRWNATGV